MDKFKNWLNHKLPPGSFIRNVATLMTGTTFAQALLILIAPILTRLYTPDDFGVYALYTSILGILSVIACLRYELAIVLPEKDEDAANLLVLCLLICSVTSLMVLVLVALFRDSFALLLSAPKISFWLWFLPASLFLTGTFQALNYWSTRRKQFKRLAIRQITQNSVTAVTQIASGASLNAGAGGLIGGYIAGQAAATGRLAWRVWKEEKEKFYVSIDGKSLKNVLILYRNFPLYTLWANLLNVASHMIIPVLLGYFFSPAVVGFYALGHRVLTVPMNVAGGAIAQVFFPRANEAKINGNLEQITFDVFKKLVAIGLVPLALIAISAPDLFSLVFGKQWAAAGEYVRYLSIWIFFQFISSPMSTVYFVMNKQIQLLISNICLFVSRIGVLLWGGFVGNDLFIIKFLGLCGAIIYFGICFYIMKVIDIPIKKVFGYLVKQSLLAAPYICLPILFLLINTGETIYLLSVVLSLGVFLIINRSIFFK